MSNTYQDSDNEKIMAVLQERCLSWVIKKVEVK